jgi:hypothetical protein
VGAVAGEIRLDNKRDGFSDWHAFEDRSSEGDKIEVPTIETFPLFLPGSVGQPGP